MEDINLLELEIPRILNTIQRKAEIKIVNEKDSSEVLRYGILNVINSVHAMRFSGCEDELMIKAIDTNFETLSRILLMVNNNVYNETDEFKKMLVFCKKELVKQVLVQDFTDIISVIFFQK